MENSSKLTRREALQGMAGIAAATMISKGVAAERPEKGAPASWPRNAVPDPQRLRAFNDDWRFHRGDASGAEAAAFEDSAWRALDVPHDWSIEDLPLVPDQGSGAIWTEGTSPVRT